MSRRERALCETCRRICRCSTTFPSVDRAASHAPCLDPCLCCGRARRLGSSRGLGSTMSWNALGRDRLCGDCHCDPC